jgi:hypothetical protein
MAKQIEVERAPAGNGVALPYQVSIDGELLRTKGGVARRFKTEEAARKAAAPSRADKPMTTNQMVALFAEVLAA